MKSPQDQAIEVGKQMNVEESKGSSIRKLGILSKRFQRLLLTLSEEEFRKVELAIKKDLELYRG